MLVGAAVLVGVLTLGVFALRSMEDRLIFFPAPYPIGSWDPGGIGDNVREVSFRTDDGVLLYAWWFGALPDAAGAPVVLWAHGNAGNLTGRAPHAQMLAARGLSVLVFDYRGYGKSEGSPDETGIYIDAEAAYAFITEELQVPPDRVVLMGRSLGSAPAARLATRVPHAATVLVAPIPSAVHMARRMFGGLPVGPLVRSRFPVIDWVRERDTPLLVIHGDRDGVVPLSYGLEVFDAAADPKQFLELAGAGHNDILSVSGDRYLDPLVAFIRSAVPAEGLVN